jgi:transcriptional regulator with XRE-family HTH domain
VATGLDERWAELVTTPERFGPTLRRLREARGVSLERIASTTKVPASLWAAMERNDLARWPTGIYARAYMRSYAELVGLDPDKVVDLFCRFFPHGDRRVEPVLRAAAQMVQHELRWEDDLGAAGTPDRRAPRGGRPDLGEMRSRSVKAVRAVTADLAVIFAAAVASSALTGWSFWVVAALLVSLAYTACLVHVGTSPLKAWLEREFHRLRTHLTARWSAASVQK